MNIVYIFGIISTFITFFGLEGRGRWSKNIAIVGGNLWLLSVIYAFYSLAWQKGVLFLIGTFLFGSILQKILRPILNSHGN